MPEKAYDSLCPKCEAVVEVDKPTSWTPVPEPDDLEHGDGGWSRSHCENCKEDFLVHWTGTLPEVISETFYQGRLAIRMRVLMGFAPDDPKSPRGLTTDEVLSIIKAAASDTEATANLAIKLANSPV